MAFYDALTRHLTSTEFLRDAGYVNGNWIGGNGAETFDVLNPATGEKLATLPEMGATETAAAIDAAYNQMPDNQYLTSDLALPVEQRRPSEYLHRLAQAEVVAQLESHGLVLRGVFHEAQAVPRIVYVAQLGATGSS